MFTACLLVLITSLGCGGGGGGGQVDLGGGSGEGAALAGMVRSFVDASLRGDEAGSTGFLSERLRAQSTQILATLKVIDLGRDPVDPTDNATWTFVVPAGGVYFGSLEYAEIYSYFETPAGNRLDLTFKLVKLEDRWFIDDFTLGTVFAGTLQMPLYFPLHVGDTWKYAESVNGVESPYLTVRTVLANPETVDGKQVFSIRETFEPVKAGTTPAQAPTGGVFVKYGGVHRFSNTDGVWDFGPAAGNGVYQSNGGNPLKLAEARAGVGSLTWSGSVSETWRGAGVVSTCRTQIATPWNYAERLGNFPTVPLLISNEFAAGAASPLYPGTTSLQRWYYLKDGLGVVAWFADDRNTGLTLQEGWLVEARINGQIFRPADWPFAILTANRLSDGAVGEPLTKTFTARWGTPPLTWTKTAGDLPAGLTLSADGVLTGTFSQAGTHRFTLRASDRDGKSATREFTVTVRDGLAITSPSVLPAARVGTAFSFAFAAREFGPTCRWAVASGSFIPQGLTFDAAAGTLSGTPTVAGTYLFQIQATNETTKFRTTRTFELAVRPVAAGPLLVSRCLAFQTSTGISFLLDFADDRGQTVSVAPDLLASAVFRVTDRLTPKAGGAEASAVAIPAAVSARGQTVTLTFASDAIDLRSTTIEVLASGVVSSDYTRVSTGTVILPENLGRFLQFVPWSSLAGGRSSPTPRRISATGASAGEILLVYADGVRSIPLLTSTVGASLTVRLGEGPGTAWGADAAADDLYEFLPLAGADFGYGLAGGGGTPRLVARQRGSDLVRRWDLNASAAWVPSVDPRYFGIIDPTATEPVFLVGDRESLLAYRLRSSGVEQVGAFSARPRGLAAGKNGVFTLAVDGSVRRFAWSPVTGLSDGRTVGTISGLVPVYPSTPAPENGFLIRQVGADLTFDLTDPAQQRFIQINLATGLVNGVARGGDAARSGFLGRLRNPFGFVRLTIDGRAFTAIADADGLQIIEDRDAAR